MDILVGYFKTYKRTCEYYRLIRNEG